MKQFFKQNITLVLAFALPLFLIFVVALNAYFPSLFFKTEYNFVYAACDSTNYDYSYGCGSYAKSLYTIENNKLVVKTINPEQDTDKDGVKDVAEAYTVRLFLHNTEINESREISLEEAQKLSYDKLLTSPDDVTISSGYSSTSGPMIFDGGSSYGYYLMKGKLRSKLHLINDDRYYSTENFHFIGWVLK